MKCKCEFRDNKKRTTADINAGELFRFECGSFPQLRVEGGFCCLETGRSSPLRVDAGLTIVRIRIDRVDSDGVPVFVDA